MAGDLRRLVDDASTTYAEDGKSTGRHHPLGHKIPKTVSFQHSGTAVPLPRGGDGLERLQSAMKAPLLNIDPTHVGSIWRALLVAPGLALALPTPSTSELIERDIAIPPADHGLVRHFALGAVLKPSAEKMSESGAVVAARFAAAANLTVLIDPAHKGRAADAWVEVEWKLSASAMAGWMARQLEKAGPAAVERIGTASLALLIHPHRAGVAGPEELVRLANYAAAFGFKLTTHVLDRSNFEAVRKSLQGKPPSAMVVLGPSDDTTKMLVAAQSFDALRRSMILDVLEPEELIDTVATGIAGLAGISPGFYRIGDTADEIAVDVLATPPVTNPVACYHDERERWYLRDGETGLWWTRDTAGHAGTVFKTYTRSGGQLVHAHDHDADGQVIEKFKGATGLTINLAELHSCQEPARHVR